MVTHKWLGSRSGKKTFGYRARHVFVFTIAWQTTIRRSTAKFLVNLRHIMWCALNQWKGRIFVRGVIIYNTNCFGLSCLKIHVVFLPPINISKLRLDAILAWPLTIYHCCIWQTPTRGYTQSLSHKHLSNVYDNELHKSWLCGSVTRRQYLF